MLKKPPLGDLKQYYISTGIMPLLTYAKCERKKGQKIDTSYNNMYSWIEKQGYKPHKGDVTHFEECSMHQDPYSKDPGFLLERSPW